MRRPFALAALAVVAGTLAAPASADTIAIGLGPDASRDEVAAAVAAATGGTLAEALGPLDALVFEVDDARAARAAAADVSGVAYAEPAGTTRRLAFTPTDPLVGRQW